MSDNAHKNPASMGRLEREALMEIAATKIRKSGAFAITITFVATLAFVFIADALNFANLGKTKVNTEEAEPIKSTFQKILAFNRHLMDWQSHTENHLFEKSITVKQLQPIGQAAFASLREGAKDVMIGKDGWLFHRPSFDLLTQKPEKSSDAFSGPQDSIKAIAALSTALNERGIKLVIMPTWPKTSAQLEQFGATRPRNGLAMKPEWFASWSMEIKKTSAYLYDPADSIREAKATQNGIAYLRADSHWNPVTMMTCARNLAEDLLAKNWISPGTEKSLLFERRITNEGDLARMLRLPAGWQDFTKQETTISEVRTKSKERWLPNRQSPVLLLGDSYSNIFSLKSMGWGEDAGFSEHLGANLGFPIDCILRNGDGAHATRAELSAELARGKDRLAGKKLVIWQFSATELTAGNWKPMTYHVGQHADSDEFLEIDAGKFRKINATITSMGPVPHPTSTVYKDYVGYFELEEIAEKSTRNAKTTKIFCFGLVIKDHEWTELAGLRPGQKIKVTLGSWADAENEFGRHQRAEPDGELASEPPNWIRQVEPTAEQ